MAAGVGDIAFDVLVDAGDATGLTAAERVYGGALRFGETGRACVFATFVTTIDGVASLGITDGTDSSTISDRSEADRFVMALLRAASDAVLIGAQTLRATPGHRWLAEVLCPERAEQLAEYRAALGVRGNPTLVVVTASGSLPDHPALRLPGEPALAITTTYGAA
jgi:riboflavin biosynthesis pyrimidine reductase